MPAWTPKLKKDQDYNGKTTLRKWWVMVSALFDDLAAWTQSHAEGAVLDHPDQSVTATKLADGAVNTGKLADGAVNAAKLAAGSVGTSALQSGAVTATKLKDGSITRQKLHPAFTSPQADKADRVTGVEAAGGGHYYGTDHTKAVGFFPIPGAEEVYVYDPTTGADGLLEDVIHNLFNALKPAPITVGELAGAGLTVQQIKDKRATVLDVSINGKIILGG